jgi:hypothetical protein
MLSGANAFEISDIQEEKTEAVLTGRSESNNVTLRRMDPDQSTGPVLKGTSSSVISCRLAGALASTRPIRNQLFGLKPTDPLTISMATSVRVRSRRVTE